MDYSQLQQDFKSDLTTISKLEMRVISAKELYGSILAGMIKLSFLFVLINTILCSCLHLIGLYYPSINFSLLLILWLASIIPSILIGIMLSQFFLFSKLVKRKLKTELFIRNKCVQLGFVFFLIYGGLYLIITAAGLTLTVGDDMEVRLFLGNTVILFFAFVAQIFSFLASMIATSSIAGMEIQRLGIGLMFEVITNFVNKAKRSPLY